MPWAGSTFHTRGLEHMKGLKLRTLWLMGLTGISAEEFRTALPDCRAMLRVKPGIEL